MPDLLKADANGVTIWIEPAPTYGSELTTSLEDVADRTVDAVAAARETIVGLAHSIAQTVQTLDDRAKPSEFSVEFGLKFNAEGRAIVAKAGAEASLKLVLKYSNQT